MVAAPGPGRRSISAATPTVNAAQPEAGSAAQARLKTAYAALPLAFEANQGQTDPEVNYMARGAGYKLYLTADEAVLSLGSRASATLNMPKQMMKQRLLGYSLKTKKLIRRPSLASSRNSSSVASLRMHLVNGNAQAQTEGEDALSAKVNYFIGSNPNQWHKGVKQFARVSYKGVYPGVDLTYHGAQSQLEFDLVIAPAANPEVIGLGFAGVKGMETDASGNLVLASSAGNLTLHAPVAYQERDGSRQLVGARFVIKPNHEVGFKIGSYDRSRALVIDPTLSYATYLGGNDDDEAYGIAVDTAGNFYVTGESDSTSGFPGGNPSLGGYDSFVVKINADGTLGYTTFVGGSGDDLGSAIAVNATTGAVYVAGITDSTDLPATSGAAQVASGSPSGSMCTVGTMGSAPCTDAFVFELDPSGSTTYLTYLGGNNDDGAYGIALDGSGNAYVTGFTFSSNFPLQKALYPALNGGAFEDAFVTEVNPTGTGFVYSTYLGGTNNDFANGIAVDSSGDAFVTGFTTSTDFPVTTGAFQTTCGTDANCNSNGVSIFSDVFVTELASGGSKLNYSTYLGGSSDDIGLAIAIDSSGNIYVTGQTTDDNTAVITGDFPVVGGFEDSYGNGSATAGSNGFVSELQPAGKGASDLIYSSYLGGSTSDVGLGIAVDHAKNAYITGSTLSGDFPNVNAFQTKLNGDSDAFVTQVAAGGATLGYSSFLGGTGDENYDSSDGQFLGGAVALDSSADVFVSGSTTSSSGFPVTKGAVEGAYGGDPFDAFAATVTAPGFAISATTPSAVSPGSSGSSTVTLTSNNGYNSKVNLSCSVSGSGSPLPGCSASSFSPTSVTPTTSGANSTLTITTTGASAAISLPRKFYYAMWLPIAGLSLIGMGFSSAPSRRKKVLGFLMIGMVMAGLFLMPACGGGSSSGGGGGGGCSGCTPAGSYTVTITGTGTDANATTNSTTVTLTVN